MHPAGLPPPPPLRRPPPSSSPSASPGAQLKPQVAAPPTAIANQPRVTSTATPPPPTASVIGTSHASDADYIAQHNLTALFDRVLHRMRFQPPSSSSSADAAAGGSGDPQATLKSLFDAELQRRARRIAALRGYAQSLTVEVNMPPAANAAAARSPPAPSTIAIQRAPSTSTALVSCSHRYLNMKDVEFNSEKRAELEALIHKLVIQELLVAPAAAASEPPPDPLDGSVGSGDPSVIGKVSVDGRVVYYVVNDDVPFLKGWWNETVNVICEVRQEVAGKLQVALHF